MDTISLLVGDSADPRLTWHCPPPGWEISGGTLRIETAAETDFWQRTHYGFRADNGHFLYIEQAGDFVMETRARLLPVHQYDQAGLMVRISPDCWLKTSVEFEPETADRLGAVVTNGGYSDWSTQDVHGVREARFRVTREGADYLVEADTGSGWAQLRVARLHEDDGHGAVSCGVYACSPKGAGFRADFLELRLTPQPRK